MRQISSRSRFDARSGTVVVRRGVVVATDRSGWIGLQWRTLADRLVKTGAVIEEVDRGADAEDERTPEAAP